MPTVLRSRVRPLVYLGRVLRLMRKQVALGYLEGYWLGDGYRDQRRLINEPFAGLMGQNKDLPRVEKALKCLGWKYRVYWRPTLRGVSYFKIKSRELYRVLLKSGLWENGPLDECVKGRLRMRALIAGFFDADGNVQWVRKYSVHKPTIHIRLTGINVVQMLAVGRVLCDDFGLYYGFYKLEDKRLNRKVCFQIKIHQRSVREFFRLFRLQPYQMARAAS